VAAGLGAEAAVDGDADGVTTGPTDGVADGAGDPQPIVATSAVAPRTSLKLMPTILSKVPPPRLDLLSEDATP